MLEAKLYIEIPALSALAAAIARINQPLTAPAASAPPASGPAPVTSMTTAAPSAPPMPPCPIIPAPHVAPPPVAAASPAPAAPMVPTAPTPSFTHDQVGKAGADLIAANAAKMPELLALLQQFGVPAITELKPEQLGPFATALRGLGAKL